MPYAPPPHPFLSPAPSQPPCLLRMRISSGPTPLASSHTREAHLSDWLTPRSWPQLSPRPSPTAVHSSFSFTAERSCPELPWALRQNRCRVRLSVRLSVGVWVRPDLWSHTPAPLCTGAVAPPEVSLLLPRPSRKPALFRRPLESRWRGPRPQAPSELIRCP